MCLKCREMLEMTVAKKKRPAVGLKWDLLPFCISVFHYPPLGLTFRDEAVIHSESKFCLVRFLYVCRDQSVQPELSHLSD